MIVPTFRASLRTRNRIREHNLKRRHNCDCTPKSRARERLFYCTDEGCNWLGWLPRNEFAVKETV